MPFSPQALVLAIGLVALGACSPVEDPSQFPAYSEASAEPPPARKLTTPTGIKADILG